MFSAFGFVHKIATFEKTAGFQVYSMNKIIFLLYQVEGCQIFFNVVFVFLFNFFLLELRSWCNVEASQVKIEYQ